MEKSLPRKSLRSDFYLAKNKPTFSRGFKGILSFDNLSGEYKILLDKNKKEIDARAIGSDWQAVGNDIKHAIETYERSKGNNRTKR